MTEPVSLGQRGDENNISNEVTEVKAGGPIHLMFLHVGACKYTYTHTHTLLSP